jgi:hypothetical protein
MIGQRIITLTAHGASDYFKAAGITVMLWTAHC